MTFFLFKDLALYLPSIIVPAIVYIICLPLITRHLSPSEYGDYTLTLNTISALSISMQWIGMSVIRFYSEAEVKNELSVLFASIKRVILPSAIIPAGLLLCVLLAFREKFDGQLLAFLSLGILIFGLSGYFDALQSILRAKRLIGFYSLLSICRLSIGLLLGIFFMIVFEWGGAGLLTGSAAILALCLPIASKLAGVGKVNLEKSSPELIKNMLSYSMPLVAGNVAAWVLNVSDRYLIRNFRGPSELGIYALGYTIADYSILMIVSLFGFAINPLIVMLFEKQGVEKAAQFMSNATRVYILCSIPVVAFLWSARAPILTIFAPEEYWQGANVMPFVAVSGFIVGLHQRFGAGMILYKKSTPGTLCLIIAGLLNVMLNFVFVPVYGYLAAAVTTLASYLFLLFLMAVVSRRWFRWRFPFLSLFRASAAALAQYWTISLIIREMRDRHPIVVVSACCLSFAIYFVGLLVAGEIKRDELWRAIYYARKRQAENVG